MKEKKILGKLYNANDNELINERTKAKNICYEYNNLKPYDMQREKDIKFHLTNIILNLIKENFRLLSGLILSSFTRF